MPSQAEYEEGWRNLQAADFQVDVIITHTASTSIIRQFRIREDEYPLNAYLEQVLERCSYRKWYFGHVHKDVDIDDKHIKIYQRVVRLDLSGDRLLDQK